MELVETQKPAFLRNRGRRALDRIEFVGLPVLDLLPIDVDPLMDVGHELVEMNAAFAHDRAGLEEEVHEHGLATADLAIDVEAFERLTSLFALSEQPAERRRLARQPVLIDPSFKRSELARQDCLA